MIPLPLLCIKFSIVEFFSNTERFLYKVFLLRWDKKTPTETRDIPLLCKKFFDTRTFLRHRRAPLRNFSVPWNKTIFTETSVTGSLLLSPTFFDTRNWRNTLKGSLAKFFGTVRQKVCGGELWCSLNLPPPSYPWLFSIPKFFFKHRTVPLRNVSEASNKHFRWRIVMPVPFRLLNIFRYRNFFEAEKGSSTN